MEDKYSVAKHRSGIWKSLRDGEFEEEIWDVLKNRTDFTSGVPNHKDKAVPSSSVPATRHLSTAPKMIPRSSNHNSSGSGSGSSFHEAKVVHHQQSAPINIPDWSKIYRNNNQKKTPKNVSFSRSGDDNDLYHSEDDGDGAVNYGRDSDDEDDSKLPPHELIDRRLARNQISSFSVLEGVGRTLKGRDLSKVRNAVLTKTGFLE